MGEFLIELLDRPFDRLPARVRSGCLSVACAIVLGWCLWLWLS